MDNENLDYDTTVSEPELSPEELDALWEDDDWDDSPTSEADQPEEGGDPSAPDGARDQGDNEQHDPADQQGRQQEDKPADQQGEAKPPELFTLKNRDEVRQVNREEMTALAQKGWDYDNVRGERDTLRQEMEDARPALDLIDRYAQMSGMDRAGYLDFVRREELKAQGLDDVNAQAQVNREKWEAQQQAQTRAMAEQQAQREAMEAQVRQQQMARRRDMEAFVKAYPGVKGADITPDVWQDASACGSLLTAYTRAENRRLTAEIAAMKQNEANRQKSTGGMGGHTQTDDTDALWGDDGDEW